MTISNRIKALAEEARGWRHHIHQHPELRYEEVGTAAFVAEKLRGFGLEVHEGLGKTGVVGLLTGEGADRARMIGLRADMDALPIHEANDLAYKSKHENVMHACGHDGHTAMLLGAAAYLSENRDFDGKLCFIFQPAEEGGAGAKAMIDDGLFERYACDEVYGLHNMPGIPQGHFGIRPGAQMASSDYWDITVEGHGGHAAFPHTCVDPVIAAGQLVQAFQSVISRTMDPLTTGVLSVTMLHAGDTHNVIPQSATLGGTVRALSEETRQMIRRRMIEICEGTEKAFGVSVALDYREGYPPTENHAGETEAAAAAAAAVAGTGKVDPDTRPVMGSEDFAYMLLEKPGAYIFLGNGDSADLHNPGYDFNDDALELGISYWVQLARDRLAAG